MFHFQAISLWHIDTMWPCRLHLGTVEQLQWTAAWSLRSVAVLLSTRPHVLVCCRVPSPVQQVIMSIVCYVFIIRCLLWSTDIVTTMTRKLYFRLLWLLLFCVFIFVWSVIIPKHKLRFPGHQISWVTEIHWVIEYAVLLHGLAEQWRPQTKQNSSQR